jgi:anti-sigma B factor antagonist
LDISQKDLAPGIVALELSGALQSSVECTRLDQHVDQLLRDNVKCVVLDLSALQRADSRGIGQIVQCFSRLKKAGGSLCLSGVNHMIRGALELTHVDRFLKMYPSTREAAASFSASAGPA